jgi:AraC-like DNA-binding protein
MEHIHRHVLHEGPLCTLAYVCCRHPHGGPGPEEEGWGHSLVLPVSGVFVRHVEGRAVVGSAAQILFFNAGEVYRVSHPVEGGDDCLSLAYSDELLFSVLEAVDTPAAERRQRPFARTHLAIDPEEALAFHGLRHRLARGEATTLEAEEHALALLVRLGRRASEGHAVSSASPDTRRRRREWAEAVQLLLAKDPASDRSLADLGQVVACSPFHLARSFQAEVGLPIHRYALRQRLLLSLERLAQGERDLTGLALDLGFASHSHFSATFQRTFEISPSVFRATASTRRLREVRKNAKA